MKRILVGFDGSEPSRHAVAMAAKLASSTGTGLLLAEVVPQLYIPGDAAGAMTAELMERDHRIASKQLDAEAAALREGGAGDVKTEIFEGSPPAEMVRAAEEDPEVEMVVVGRSGKGAVKRAVLGSVAGRLAHACTKPVLIV